MALAAGALALTIGAPVGASTVEAQRGAVRSYDNSCDGNDRFYDGNGCCYNG